MKKKIIATALGTISIFLVSVLSFYFYSKTDHAKNLIVNKINVFIPGTLSADGLEFSFINTLVKLEGIQILDQQNNRCFTFSSLMIDFTISSLFKKVLEINLFRLDNPEISLRMHKNGRINLMDALIQDNKKSIKNKEGKKGLPINVIVRKAQVTEGTLHYSDMHNQIELKSIDLKILNANLQNKHLSMNALLKNSKIILQDKEILIKNFSLLAELEQGSKINFDLDLDSDLAILKAKGSTSNIAESPEIDVDIVATSGLEQFNLFLEDKVALGGLAKVIIKGKGSVNNPKATLKLDVADLKINKNQKTDRIKLSATLADRTLLLDKGIINILGNNITFNGTADLKAFFPKGFLHPPENPDSLTYDFSFDQKNGDFKHFGQFKNLEKKIKEYSGQFSSFGKITGKGISPETMTANYHFNIVLENFKQNKPGTDFMDVTADMNGTIENGIFNLTRLTGKTGKSSIDGKAQIDISRKNIFADLSFKSQDLYPTTTALGIPPVKGSIDSRLNLSGAMDNPEIKAKIAGKNLMAKDFSINDLQFTGSINPSGHATIQQLSIQNKDLALELKGSAQVFDKAFKLKDIIQADILISGQNINPQRFLESFDIKANPDLFDSLLNFNLDMDADYTIGASMGKKNFLEIEIPIKNIEADIDLGKKEFSMAIGKIASLNASLDTENNGYNTTIEFNRSDLTPLFKSLGINGLRTGIHGQINASGIIPVDLSENVIKGLNATQGNIALIADINGSFKEPDFNALVDLSNIAYDGTRAGIKFSSLNGNIMVTPDKISINAQIDINLQHDPMESQKTGKLPVQEIPIKNIIADLNLNDPGISVLMDKTIDLKASFDLENSDYDLGINFHKTPLEPLFKNLGFYKVKGEMNGHLTSKGKTNIALPEEIIHGLKQATGELSCSADIKGSLEKPDFNAVVTLTDLGYPIPQAGTSISNLNGRIKVSKDMLKIENIAADIDSGSLGIDGEIGLRDFKPKKASLKFTGNNIALELPDTAKIEFNYDLNFSGTREKSDLSGTFILDKGEYYKDFTFDLAEAMGGKKRETSTPKDKNNTPAPLIENTSLNIDVDYKDPFIVDNNLAFILIEPNINIIGTAANPIITGRTKIVEGTIIYLKKEFEIEKGIIDFSNPYKIDPDIDLAAKIQVRDWTINLEVSGKTENLKFRLFSQPEETHKDILSLLIAGKTTKELGKGQGGSYTSILTDKASDIIGETVEESTPLDSFKVGYDDSGSEGVNVTLGKKLSKRLEVLYSMETIDKETVHKNAAEYKILENIMLKAFNDSKGDFGTEVTFKLEFR
ncbi:MAG: hypothetical protein B6230_01790 [Desulfobacteraceae bacterium 4572_89]|nr:MAG: hypothetical protein B6230_01790 [Desulfobacteraceae bacterium 4572_89]